MMSVFTRSIFIFSAVILLRVTCGFAQPQGWTATPFNPPCLPLAVRSPYLNAWLNQGPKSAPVNNLWPNLWTPKTPTIVGWSAAIQVDNVTYSILGQSPVWPNSSIQISSEFTPTQTTFKLKAGPVNVTASFLSPINPTDLVRLSLPFSYFYMNITANDGKSHNVRVYSDISGEWVSGNLASVIDWSATTQDGIVTLQTQRQTIAGFTEINDHAEDATAYYSTLQQSGVSFKIAQDSISRGLFVSNGSLDNSVDNNFRGVSQDFAVFALSANLGNIEQTTTPIVWGLGLFRDPAIQYTTSDDQVQLRSSYFWSQYTTALAAVKFSLGDFQNALNNATALDAQITADASQYSSDYADLLALSLRQALGPLDITIARDSAGDWNTSDVKVFMKDLGSGSGGVNVVDVLYAAFPAYLYLNPQLGKYLLAPLLEFQESSAYTNAYAAQNLGTSYPNATGNTDAHNLGIEESANMLIMTLAHVQATGDASIIVQHYNLLKSWADYLVTNSLSPDSQITDDGLAANNQTNLAVKGIIGIASMEKISAVFGDNNSSVMYQNISSSYIKQWEALSTSSQGSHLLSDYGDQSSSGLIYNLYADRLLQLNIVPDSIYGGQTSFYTSQLQQESNTFGLPTDSSNPTAARTDWMMLTAGSISDSTLQQSIISDIHRYASANLNNTPLALSYDSSNGIIDSSIASPAQGALFSLLALNRTIQTVTVSSSNSSKGRSGSKGGSTGRKNNINHHTNVGAIVGAVIGCVVGLGLIVAIFIFLRRRRRLNGGGHFDIDASIEPNPMLQYKENNGPTLAPGTIYEHFVLPMPSLETSSLQHVTERELPPTPGSVGSPLANPHSQLTGIYQASSSSSQRAAHGHSNSLSTLNPSMSASQRGNSSSVTHSSSRPSVQARQEVLLAKQTLVNEELRSEVDNLRRDLERIREDTIVVVGEAPPSYAPFVEGHS